MALAAWKRFEKTPGFQRTKLLLRRLQGRELWLRREIRTDAMRMCHWWFDPASLPGDAIVYSLGIGQDVSFEVALVDRFGAAVYAFDPTPSTIDMLASEELPSGFHFHPWAITAEDGIIRFYPRARRDGSASKAMYTTVADAGVAEEAVDVPAFTLASAARRLGHDRIDLLKMDIEGAEYEVLDMILRSSMLPTQLLVEFHHRFPGIGPKKTADVIRRLRSCGYRIFAVAETGREIGFLRVAQDDRRAGSD